MSDTNNKEKHRYLSLKTEAARENLQKEYIECGYPNAKVVISIMFTIVLLHGCICAGKLPESETTTTSYTIPAPVVKTIKTEKTTTTTTTTIKKPYTRTIVRWRYQNVSMDIKDSQEFELKNMKPKNCHSSCCSYGYFKAKVDALNILEIDHGYSFYEGPSRNFQADYNKDEIYLPVKYDNRTYYIELNRSMWTVERGNSQKWILRKV